MFSHQILTYCSSLKMSSSQDAFLFFLKSKNKNQGWLKQQRLECFCSCAYKNQLPSTFHDTLEMRCLFIFSWGPF